MRSYALALLFFGAVFKSSAQYADSLVQTLINRRCDPLEISIRSHHGHYPTATPFNNIEVFDYRRDTLRIGITSAERYRQHQFVFSTSAGTAVTTWLTKFYTDPSARNHLMVVIKDLWISDSVQPHWKYSRYEWNLRVRLEAYLPQPLSFPDRNGQSLRKGGLCEL